MSSFSISIRTSQYRVQEYKTSHQTNHSRFRSEFMSSYCKDAEMLPEVRISIKCLTLAVSLFAWVGQCSTPSHQQEELYSGRFHRKFQGRMQTLSKLDCDVKDLRIISNSTADLSI